jgi:hypothetical protein
MATQNLNLALQPIILDIDDTTSQIATLLAAQTNDQERFTVRKEGAKRRERTEVSCHILASARVKAGFLRPKWYSG